MLKDARTTLTIRASRSSSPVSAIWTRRLSDIAAVMRGATGTVVLLAHDPRRLTEAAALNIPLVLSGHTHGGQVVLPVAGRDAARRFPVVAGIGRRDETTIFVSRGVGTVYVPVRINCPPEVALLTLHAEPSPRAPDPARLADGGRTAGHRHATRRRARVESPPG